MDPMTLWEPIVSFMYSGGVTMGTSIITRVGLIAVLAAGLLSFLSQPQRVQAACNGHTVAVGMNRIKAYHTTDHNVFNNRDEVYFTGAGAISDPSGVTEIKLARISPGGKENYFKFTDRRDYNEFYQNVSGYWCLGDGETIALSVLVARWPAHYFRNEWRDLHYERGRL
jgi:hypothetical protein